MLRSARSPEDFRPLIGNNRFPRPATPRAVSRCSKTDRSKLTIPPRYSKFSPLFFSRDPGRYRRQVGEYLGLLRQMGYTQCEGYLWYVKLGEIEKVEG